MKSISKYLRVGEHLLGLMRDSPHGLDRGWFQEYPHLRNLEIIFLDDRQMITDITVSIWASLVIG